MDEREPTAAERRASLIALKKAVAIRERLPRYTDAWQKALDAEEVAVSRVQRWLYGPRD